VNAGFTIAENARLELRCAPALEGMCVLSPFVWPEGSEYRTLLRLVNRDRDQHKKISRIHAARSVDGLLFEISEEPVFAPGPDPEDAQGAEDLTVIAGDDETVVYHSIWNQINEPSRMLYSRGSSVELRPDAVRERAVSASNRPAPKSTSTAESRLTNDAARSEACMGRRCHGRATLHTRWKIPQFARGRRSKRSSMSSNRIRH